MLFRLFCPVAFNLRSKSALEYLSRCFVNPEIKLRLKLNDRIPLHDIDILVLAKTPDNALNFLAQSILITTKSIETVEITVDIQTRGFTPLKEHSINELSECSLLDSYSLTNKNVSVDRRKKQKMDKNIQETLQWLRNNKPNQKYSSNDLQKNHRPLIDLLCKMSFTQRIL